MVGSSSQSHSPFGGIGGQPVVCVQQPDGTQQHMVMQQLTGTQQLAGAQQLNGTQHTDGAQHTEGTQQPGELDASEDSVFIILSLS
jgi:hypothetical protein